MAGGKKVLFNSISFLIFFPIVTLLYFLIPHKYRWLLLLVSSCVFYMAFIPAYIFILAVTIIIDYCAGILIEKEIQSNLKRRYMWTSIFSTLMVLFIFKYFNFFNANMGRIAHFFNWNYPIGYLTILLPIGLSFHTFQSMSYVIEVYRGHQKAEHNFGIYALYVMFYPQLVAGPIERPQNMLHQFYEVHTFDYQRVTDGLKLMAWGMFKKVAIANRLAVFVDSVYNNPAGYNGISLIAATVFFAFQIYADFSGYSDIAIGAAQVMGFRLMQNFNRPYYSKSIGEFWRRWHISLSTWFKDYLYIPMGGSRVCWWRWQFNLVIVFLASGLWHGANWTFILWGALHGFYLVAGNITSGMRKKFVWLIGLDKLPLLHKLIKVTVTFVLVCFAWIFFRASSIADAIYIVNHIPQGLTDSLRTIACSVIHFRSTGQVIAAVETVLASFIAIQSKITFRVAMLSILAMEVLQLVQRKESIRERLSKRPAMVRWAAYFSLITGTLLFGYFSNQNFIYFQF